MPVGKFYPITESMRSALKKPVGELIRDDLVSKEQIQSKAFDKKDAIIVSIGDRTTETLEEFNLYPNLEIVDSIERRSPREPLPWERDDMYLFKANNPAGGITEETLKVLGKCSEMLSKDASAKLRLLITGEEDLLTLPVLAFFPGRVIALYGQPGEGMVIADSIVSRKSCITYLHEIGIFSL